MNTEQGIDSQPTEATFNNAPNLPGVETGAHLSPREIIDPNGTLPEVEFEQMREAKGHNLRRTEIAISNASDHQVGHCWLQEYRGSVHFDGVEIFETVNSEQARGQGYGLATYLKAIEIAHERGLPFETQDWNQTKDAVKIWTILKDAGVAEEIEPFRPDTSSRHPNRYKGKYRVPLPSLS